MKKLLITLSIIHFFSPLLIINNQSKAQCNSWTQKADFGGGERFEAVGFSIGSKGYIGTGYYPVEKDFWEYDPNNDIWTQKADFGGVARFNAVGFSIGNKGYIGTGNREPTQGPLLKDFWEYDPGSNTWTQKADFGGIEREGAVGFSIGNKGYLGTGKDDGMIFIDDFWEYNPVSDTWTQKADFGSTYQWYIATAVGFSINNKGYIGIVDVSQGMNYFSEYDTTTNIWTQKADFGGSVTDRAVGFSIGSKGYIGTGLDNNSQDTQDFWEYDPGNNIWIQKADFGGTKRRDAVGFSIGSKGYIGTGVGNFTPVPRDFWEYSPGVSLQPICLITVDTTSTKNVILWKKLLTTGIDRFRIYKETTSSGIYALIGNVAYDSLSSFIDVTSNPSQKADRYRITTIDTCGNESNPSGSHKTLHLTVNPGLNGEINLIWDHYEGFAFNTYRIWRSDSTANLVLIDSIQNTLTSYSDQNPPPGVWHYQIEVIHPSGCIPTKKSTYTSAISNIVDNIGAFFQDNDIIIYPNPFNNSTTIEIRNTTGCPCDLVLYDPLGRMVEKMDINKNGKLVLNRNEISTGIYFFMVRDDEQKVVGKGKVVVY